MLRESQFSQSPSGLVQQPASLSSGGLSRGWAGGGPGTLLLPATARLRGLVAPTAPGPGPSTAPPSGSLPFPLPLLPANPASFSAPGSRRGQKLESGRRRPAAVVALSTRIWRRFDFLSTLDRASWGALGSHLAPPWALKARGGITNPDTKRQCETPVGRRRGPVWTLRTWARDGQPTPHLPSHTPAARRLHQDSGESGASLPSPQQLCGGGRDRVPAL
ncbi:PREDICTED: uncharacterized protein LOC102027743 [Chinchilla lanigera]|uniref:uncharacterized protein LOC102027743 n=1 Tax=Chinchilla lanigera TaxID=34839 RepID=UPI00038F132B|nr:PREDICTED: uncharacterized protein LOC102027743 [Chinchilla lanigera]